MRTYSVTGINVGTFNLGEADKILTIFARERGLMRAVAKGARKPKARMAAKSDVLSVNRLLVARGRSLDVISQAESLASFASLRRDLERLSHALYLAELTFVFGPGLDEECREYFDLLFEALSELNRGDTQPVWLSLQFQMRLLSMLGLEPELTFCLACRQVLAGANLAVFDKELGGIVCSACFRSGHSLLVAEGGLSSSPYYRASGQRAEGLPGKGQIVQVTPLVWQQLVLAQKAAGRRPAGSAADASVPAACRLAKGYLEHRAGRRLKALDLVGQPAPPAGSQAPASGRQAGKPIE